MKFLALVIAFLLPSSASAHNFDLSSLSERKAGKLERALERSDFPWDVLPPVTVTMGDIPHLGQTWPDGHIELTDRRFFWRWKKHRTWYIQAIFLHETFHAVDFLYLTDTDRQEIIDALGFDTWDELGHDFNTYAIRAWSDLYPYVVDEESYGTPDELEAMRQAMM